MKKLGLEVFSLAFGMYGIMVLLAMTVFIVEVIIGGQKRKAEEEMLEAEAALRIFGERKKINEVYRRKKNYIEHDFDELFNGHYVVPGEVPENPRTPSLKVKPDEPEPDTPKTITPEPEHYIGLDLHELFNGN